MKINVTYQWTGVFIDNMIEATLGTKAHASGCGLGERDMQFALPDTPGVRKKIDLLKRHQGIKITICE